MKNPIVEYTEEYRNKHWKKCRYGKDLRNCGEWKWNENGQLEWISGYYSKFEDGEWHIYCRKDDKPCDAEWTGDKDE